MPGRLKGGIREKYKVAKLDPDGNEVQVDDDAVYFVLRFDSDPHARVAMRSYAGSIDGENEKLATDIRQKLKDTQAKFTARLIDDDDDDDDEDEE